MLLVVGGAGEMGGLFFKLGETVQAVHPPECWRRQRYIMRSREGGEGDSTAV